MFFGFEFSLWHSWRKDGANEIKVQMQQDEFGSLKDFSYQKADYKTKYFLEKYHTAQSCLNLLFLCVSLPFHMHNILDPWNLSCLCDVLFHYLSLTGHPPSWEYQHANLCFMWPKKKYAPLFSTQGLFWGKSPPPRWCSLFTADVLTLERQPKTAVREGGDYPLQKCTHISGRTGRQKISYHILHSNYRESCSVPAVDASPG